MFFCELHSQSLFNRAYVEDRPSMRFSSVVCSDSVCYVIGVTVNKQVPYYEQALTIKLDIHGNLLGYHAAPDTTGINTGTFWNTLITTNTGEFAFSGYGRDTTQHLVIGFLNYAFDSVKLLRYYTPNTFAFQGIKILQYSSNIFFSPRRVSAPGLCGKHRT